MVAGFLYYKIAVVSMAKKERKKERKCVSGVHMFCKSLEATSKFKAPEGLHETSSILRTHEYQVPRTKLVPQII